MTEQPEAGDIGAAGGAGGERHVRCHVVEPHHRGHRSRSDLVVGEVGLDGCGDHPDPERFGEDQILTGGETGVGHDAVGMHLAGDRQAVLGFGVIDGVTTHDREATGAGDVLPTGQQLTEEFGREGVGVPAHQVEREQRPSTHGVHIGHAVRRGDLTPGACVVDHGRDEVGGGDQGALVVEAPHGGVVAGGRAHEQLGGFVGLQVAHDVRELARGELAASTGAVAELGEAKLLGVGHAGVLGSSGLRLTVLVRRRRRPALSRRCVGSRAGTTSP